MMKKLLPLLCIATLGACVSLEEAPMARGVVRKDQRTAVIVYPSPGPVMSESNSNLEQAAKIVPGLNLILAATQSRRDLDASKELQARLPAWEPEKIFLPVLMQELASIGYIGRFLGPGEAGLSPETLKALNSTQDVVDWQERYYAQTRDPAARRNYSTILSLGDALVLEVNLAYGAPSDGKDGWIPNLGGVMKLYQADKMTLLWRHEDMVDDKAGVRNAEDFKREPLDIIAKWQKLMPILAHRMAASFQRSLQESMAPPQAPPVSPSPR